MSTHSDEKVPNENAMIWGERELQKSPEGRAGELLRQTGRYLRRFAKWLIIAALVIVVVPRSLKFVSPGHGAVLWSRFLGGTVHQKALGEGFHLIWPWNELPEFDLKVREHRIEYAALANDGLPVTAMVSLRYRVNPERLSNLYQEYGPDYEAVLIAPAIGSIVREIMSRYPADQLYAYARARLEREIAETITDKLDFGPVIGTRERKPNERDGYVFVEGIAVLDLKLPQTVTSAIEAKMAQDQMAQEYEFKVKREQMEAERRALEVDGIKHYAAVAQSPWFRDYLKYLEIQSNYDLAKSQNAKLVFMGNSTTGAPPVHLTVPAP